MAAEFLDCAARYGQEGIIKLLLDTYKVDLDVRDKKGWHALHFAAQHGQEGVIKLLIETYKVTFYVMDKNNRTPLHIAKICPEKKAYDLLVDLGAKDYPSRFLPSPRKNRIRRR